MEPYVKVDYRKEIFTMLKNIFKDVMIKDKDGKEVPLPIYAIYPKNFDNLPCITYKEVNNKSSKNNLHDAFYPNPNLDPNDEVFEYTPEEWNELNKTRNSHEYNPDNAAFYYKPEAWNELYEHFLRTGEKLWEHKEEEPEEPKENEEDQDLISLDLDDEEEEEEDKPVESIPSTPLEYPFKPVQATVYANIEYQLDFWGKSLTKIVELMSLFDEYLMHSFWRVNKTFTSEDLYETDTGIYHKIIRFSFLADNVGNIYRGW